MSTSEHPECTSKAWVRGGRVPFQVSLQKVFDLSTLDHVFNIWRPSTVERNVPRDFRDVHITQFQFRSVIFRERHIIMGFKSPSREISSGRPFEEVNDLLPLCPSSATRMCIQYSTSVLQYCCYPLARGSQSKASSYDRTNVFK